MYREAANQDITAAKLAGQMVASTIEFPYTLQSLTAAPASGGGGGGFKTAGGGMQGFAPQKFPATPATDPGVAGGGSNINPGGAAYPTTGTPLDQLSKALNASFAKQQAALNQLGAGQSYGGGTDLPLGPNAVATAEANNQTTFGPTGGIGAGTDSYGNPLSDPGTQAFQGQPSASPTDLYGPPADTGSPGAASPGDISNLLPSP